jgi:hypothetical protein
MSTTARAEGSHAIPRGRKAGVSSRAPNTSTGRACSRQMRNVQRRQELRFFQDRRSSLRPDEAGPTVPDRHDSPAPARASRRDLTSSEAAA